MSRTICSSILGALTYAESRRNAHTQQVLVDHEDGQEEAVLGPDLGYRCSSPPHQQGHHPAAMDYDQKVHPLTNHIHRHQKAYLFVGKMGEFKELKCIWSITVVQCSENVMRLWAHLQPKLVEGVVEQVLQARNEAVVQSVSLCRGEESRYGGRGSQELPIMVSLVTIHRSLKHQQHQHNQMILEQTYDRQTMSEWHPVFDLPF